MPHLLSDLPDSLRSEVTEILVRAQGLRIERIVSHGQSSPEGFWYDQDENEFVLLVQGAAHLRFEDETVAMKAGDWLHISAHRKHRVDWTTPAEKSVWLAVFYN